MSDDDLNFIFINNTPYVTKFADYISQLSSVKKSIEKMKKGVSTDRDIAIVKNFGYGYAGWDDFWSAEMKGDYTKCIKLLDFEIHDLRNRTNRSRVTWLVGEGIEKEMVSRGLPIRKRF
jgi:hypothetical protein